MQEIFSVKVTFWLTGFAVGKGLKMYYKVCAECLRSYMSTHVGACEKCGCNKFLVPEGDAGAKSAMQPVVMQLVAYEIFSENFSQIIVSSSIVSACNEFQRLNPNQTILFAENTIARDRNNTA